MANITFLIGNGFDLHFDLKTKYTHFYEKYILQPSDNELIQRFKELILLDSKQKWVNWSDFEVGMGKKSTCFDSKAEDFIECFSDFVKNFNEYLERECNNIDWPKVTHDMRVEFVNSLICFRDKFNTTLSKPIANLVRCSPGYGGKISFLQFNYTDTFERLIRTSESILLSRIKQTEKNYGVNSLGENLQVHGKIGKYPVIGVSDASQILDKIIRENQSVIDLFIKPNYLDIIQNKTVNELIDARKAINVIESSTIICIFGASIGDTDKHWWQPIGEWLKELDKRLIIFDICGEDDDGFSPQSVLQRRNEVANKTQLLIDNFIRNTSWTEEDANNNRDKIIVELDSKMFDFKLPKKNEDMLDSDKIETMLAKI